MTEAHDTTVHDGAKAARASFLEQPLSIESMLLREELTRFVLHEAKLIDQARYDEWVDLFAADGIYWVPAGRAQKDPLDHVSLFFDDKALLEGRVARLKHPEIHVQTPASRVCHVLSDILVEDIDASGTFCTSASFLMVEYRPGHPQRCFAGSVEHQIRRNAKRLEIVRKCVRLINCDAALPALAVPF